MLQECKAIGKVLLNYDLTRENYKKPIKSIFTNLGLFWSLIRVDNSCLIALKSRLTD